MIRKFVYAKKPSNLPSHASHWTADGNDVTVHFSDGRDSAKLPHYHTPETLVKSSYNRDVDDSIVVESVEPWQAEVERLKGELAIAERDASLYRKLIDKPYGDLYGDARNAELLGMKTGSGTFSANFLAFIKELIAERDAARADAKRFEGSGSSASAWKSLDARGDLKGINTPTCRDDILALVDQLKAKNSGVEEACKDLKAAISDSLNRDGEAIDSASMILAGVRYINGLKSKLGGNSGFWSSLRDNYGMPVIFGRSAYDDILSFVASLKAKVAESESTGSRIAEALGLSKDADCDAAVERIKAIKHRRDELQAAWSGVLDLCRSQGMSVLSGENGTQSILRHIRNQESANGHLADEVNRLTAEKQAKPLSMTGSAWGHLKDNFGMPNQNGRTMSEDIIDFVVSLKDEIKALKKSVEGCVLTPAKNLHHDLKQRFNMPEDNDKNYSQDIIAFVEALKKGLDGSQREVSQMHARNLELAASAATSKELALSAERKSMQARSALAEIKVHTIRGLS